MIPKKFIKKFIILLILGGLLYPSLLQKPYIYAQDIDCIGDSLAGYVAQVFQDLKQDPEYEIGAYGNVKFLSPVFNMTNASLPAFVAKFKAGLQNRGYNLSSFNKIAGNAYNMNSGTISHWIDVAQGTAIGGKPIILTEIGWYPHDTNKDVALLAQEVNNFDSNIKGGLIFNVFGYNDDYAGQEMTDDEIDTVCGGDCQAANIGANSAIYYNNQPEFYEDAAGNTEYTHHMKYTLEIANAGDVEGSIKDGIKTALNKDLIPIIRLGAAGSSGGFDDPQVLADFIRTVDSYVEGGDAVYVVIGPNEPLTERWATSDCEGGGILPSEDITTEWPEDSATFYIPREGNKEIISKARTQLAFPLPLEPPPEPEPPVDGDPFPPSPEPPPPAPAELQNLAMLTQDRTGVRAALILALLYHESGLEQFPGNGHYPGDFCCEDPWWEENNCENFVEIWNEVGSMYLGFTINSIPVSRARYIGGVYNCGGAMGPSQAMAFTWQNYKLQLENITGKDPVSPWEFEESFLLTGLHLRDRGGAHSHRCQDEKQAVCNYWGDPGCEDYENYATTIIQSANGIAERKTNEGKVGWIQCRQ